MMYAVTIGRTVIRVVDKSDAKALTDKLYDIDCQERFSSKPMQDGEEGETAEDVE